MGTIDTHGEINNEKTISTEAIFAGNRITVNETDEIGQLEPEVIGEMTQHGIVVSSVVQLTQETYETKITVYDDIDYEVDIIRVIAVGAEDPIETHPAFKEPANNFPDALAGTGEEPENGAEFETTQANAKFSYFPPDADNDLGGVESYLVPSVMVEITKRFQTFGQVNWSQIYDVGKIKDPNIDGLAVGKDRTWLLVGTQYSFETGIWSVTNQYQLSGPRGWNTMIYSSA